MMRREIKLDKINVTMHVDYDYFLDMFSGMYMENIGYALDYYKEHKRERDTMNRCFQMYHQITLNEKLYILKKDVEEYTDTVIDWDNHKENVIALIDTLRFFRLTIVLEKFLDLLFCLESS